jgi:hypothetical protein
MRVPRITGLPIITFGFISIRFVTVIAGSLVQSALSLPQLSRLWQHDLAHGPSLFQMKAQSRHPANVEAGKPLKFAVHKAYKKSRPQVLEIPAYQNELTCVLKSDGRGMY